MEAFCVIGIVRNKWWDNGVLDVELVALFDKSHTRQEGVAKIAVIMCILALAIGVVRASLVIVR